MNNTTTLDKLVDALFRAVRWIVGGWRTRGAETADGKAHV